MFRYDEVDGKYRSVDVDWSLWCLNIWDCLLFNWLKSSCRFWKNLVEYWIFNRFRPIFLKTCYFLCRSRLPFPLVAYFQQFFTYEYLTGASTSQAVLSHFTSNLVILLHDESNSVIYVLSWFYINNLVMAWGQLRRHPTGDNSVIVFGIPGSPGSSQNLKIISGNFRFSHFLRISP